MDASDLDVGDCKRLIPRAVSSCNLQFHYNGFSEQVGIVGWTSATPAAVSLTDLFPPRALHPSSHNRLQQLYLSAADTLRLNLLAAAFFTQD